MFDLKAFRTFNKITQFQLAEYLGVTQAFISQVEKGSRPIPDEYISKIKADNKYQILDSFFVDESEEVNYKQAINEYLTINEEGVKYYTPKEVIELMKAQIKALEEENKQLKNDKIILQDFINLLQNKK